MKQKCRKAKKIHLYIDIEALIGDGYVVNHIIDDGSDFVMIIYS